MLSAADRAWEWIVIFAPQARTPENDNCRGRDNLRRGMRLLGIDRHRADPVDGGPYAEFCGAEPLRSGDLYELGRNFFLFGAPLGRLTAFVTGFAHVHRFHAIDACSLTGAPWDGQYNFNDYRKAMLIGLLNTYEADKS